MSSTEFKNRIEQIYTDLDRYSYYELFNLTPEASPDQIRVAFHRMALSVHPDHFQQHEDQDLRDKVYAIYKRMTEGYRVLMDSQDRKEYTTNLAQGKMRFIRTARKVSGPKRTEDAILNPAAKKFFTLAMDAERLGDFKSAKMNYQLALNMVPDDELIKSHLEKLEEKSENV